MSITQFESLEEMAQKLEILTMADVKKMFTAEEAHQFHDHNEVAMIYAHTESKNLIENLMAKHKLYPITYSIHDGEDSSDFVYDTGFTYVNREGFLLCRVEANGTYIDTHEGTSEEEIE